jgi:multicomponent Na+:H+ antiporter subunit C
MRWLGHWPYFATIVLMMIGLYIVIARENLVKKMMGLNVFQVSVIMFYVAMGNVEGGTAPILIERDGPAAVAAVGEPIAAEPDVAAGALQPAPGVVYSNPLPHVLMLTAIVVGVATTALGLSFIVRIHEGYGNVEEDAIASVERAVEPGA